MGPTLSIPDRKIEKWVASWVVSDYHQQSSGTNMLHRLHSTTAVMDL